ncbi:MAG: hypothetical protein M0C28_44615 [Candidatus Moduliflexus flocculans]|nr:hypothetical protein [Candidatus Moduliflexus flocculans]
MEEIAEGDEEKDQSHACEGQGGEEKDEETVFGLPFGAVARPRSLKKLRKKS